MRIHVLLRNIPLLFVLTSPLLLRAQFKAPTPEELKMTEDPKAPVYVDGRLHTTLKGDRIVAEFIDILNDYVTAHY